MLGYMDQSTPPSNSPYQRHMSKGNTLNESPYPSPVRHDSRTKYTEGLGIYGYQQTMPHGLPPSPQPSEVWNGHLSTVMSPLMTETIADPWASGAFDHPVSHSPLPWTSAHTSPRSSLGSCPREMSVFSHEGSDLAFSGGIKAEYPRWAPERWAVESVNIHHLSPPRPQPLTVAPERLSAANFAYDHSYGSSSSSKLESAPMYDYGSQDFDRGPSEESIDRQHSKSRSKYSSVEVPRERARNRRHTDPATAAYRCHLCTDKGFARRYNYNQHMLTHDVTRRKDNVCTVPGCGKEFVRKTDLSRHDQSVHQKVRPYKCERCPNAFPRKDTLRR
jgi:hypothetical protein